MFVDVLASLITFVLWSKMWNWIIEDAKKVVEKVLQFLDILKCQRSYELLTIGVVCCLSCILYDKILNFYRESFI